MAYTSNVSLDDVTELSELLGSFVGTTIVEEWELFIGCLGVQGSVRRELRTSLAGQDPKLCLLEGLKRWVASDKSPRFEKILWCLRGDVFPSHPLAARVESFARMKYRMRIAQGSESAPKKHFPPPPATRPTSPASLKLEKAKAKEKGRAEAKIRRQQEKAEKEAYAAKMQSIATRSLRSMKPADYEEDPTFPFLPAAALTPHQKDCLEGRLIYHSHELLMQFGNLVVAIRKSLNEHQEPRKLIDFLLEYAQSQERKGVYTGYYSDLQKAETLHDFFNAIRPYYSFFDHQIMELLVNTFGTAEDEKKFATYMHRFNDFCRRRVYECPIDGFKNKHSNEISLVFKLQEKYETMTLFGVKQFRSKICAIFGLHADALRFLGLGESGVEFCFALFDELDPVVFPLSAWQRERLQREGVVELKGASCEYSFGDDMQS